MTAFYYALMTAIGYACIQLGWDSINGVPLYQLSILFGGVVLGHVATEALNSNEVEGDE